MVVMNHTVGSAVDARLVDEQRGLLDLVDKLQVARLENVKLPQIVVVGDQSAGKSSVLEAITGTPFPRDAGACTRFATEIRLRRAPETSLKVSIIPDKNRSYRDQEKLRLFGDSMDLNTPFDALMRLAVELIAPKNIPGRFAARDILVVEKRGPDMPLLTLVDLPGLVRNANNDQSLEDIQTIETLSDRYMKSSRTIILAVVGGNSDYVQAPILTKARYFDPSGARTIGVLTKPDLTESIGLEDKFIDLVLNNDRRNHFRLGWYVLKNSGPLQHGQNQPWPTPQERKDREDEFFSQGKWSVLPKRMRGADALKVALSLQLQRHIGRHVKLLRKQIQKALEACEAELKSLGTGMDTPEEMRIDLVSLFSNSKELVIPALNGWYKNPRGVKFFRSTLDPNGTPVQNLRARATEENERFSNRIRSDGRKFNFTASNPRVSIDSSSRPITRDNEKKEFARREVAMLLHQIRGSEFPMDPKPRAVYMLFAEFSEYWPRLAQEHKDNLGVICNEFLSELIDYTWPKRMHDPLRLNYLDNQMKTLMEKAQAELDTLMQDMQFEVQPYDPEYEERIKLWRADITKEGGGPQTEAEEVLEKMLIYYEICAKTFVRNIITQVIERHLLQGISTIFNSIEALNMDNQAIEAIAAEDRATRDKRLTLKAQKKDIEAARDLCANLAMRKELRMYAEDDRELGEDSSDEEARIKTPSTPSHPPSADAPSSASPISTRQRQRSSRQPRDEQLQAIPNRQDPPAQVQTGSGSTPAYQASPPTSATFRAPPDLDDYDRPPQRPSAPPPPPRPEKVRTELDSPAPPTADSYYNPAATLPTSSRVDCPTNRYHHQVGTSEYGAGPECMDYLGQGAPRKGIRKVFGRT